MMDNLFLQILNLSFAGSIAIAFVLILRLLLRKAPKIFSYALWVVVLFRLLCPFSFESAVSILPTQPAPIPMDIGMQLQPKVETGIPMLNEAVNTSLPAAEEAQALGASINPLQIWIGVGEFIWFCGAAALLLYSVVSLLCLRNRLVGAIPQGDRVYLVEGIETPFVMGVFAPKIYLPAGLSAREQEYILLHERTHIRRLDHIVKLVAFFTLCLHWFNPLVWLSFFLLAKDMELSCDESVIRKLGDEVKRDYSTSLLSLATGRRMLAGTPLAFGEGDTKHRIQHVLNYKKPAFWAVVASLILVVVACVTLGLNPRGKQEFSANFYRIETVVYNWMYSSQAITAEDAPYFYEVQGGVSEGAFQSNTLEDAKFLACYERGAEESNYQDVQKVRLSRAERLALVPEFATEARATLSKVRTIYRTATDDGSFRLLMQDDDGVLVAHGQKLETGKEELRMMFRLAPLMDLGVAETLHKYRTPYLGDNSAVGNLIAALHFPEELGYTGFSLETEDQHALNITFQPENVPEGAIKAFYESLLQKDAMLLLSLIGNLEYVNVSWGENHSAGGMGIARDMVEPILGYNYFKQGETVEGVRHMLREILGLRPGHSEEEVERQAQLHKAVADATLEKRKSSVKGEITTEGHSIFDSQRGTRSDETGREIETLRLYTYSTIYHFLPREDGFESPYGSEEFAVFDFDVSDKGVYLCTDYRYGEAVKEEMSTRVSNLWMEALPERLQETCRNTCFLQAVEEGGVNRDLAIERLLALVTNGDEATAKEARWQLEAYGEMTLQYCYRAFLEGGQSGPRADLMSELCQAITKQNRDTWADSWGPDPTLRGQAWFDAFRVSMEQEIAEKGIEAVQPHRQDASVLLAILSE